MATICPGCGLNLERERLIEDGPFAFDPTIPAFLIDGQRVRCRPQVRELLGSLMQARGRTLTFDVLLDRMGSNAGVAAKLMDVVLHHAREVFAAADHPFPVERVGGVGLRWRQV
jgi:DNA-binding response OmpR family regulator